MIDQGIEEKLQAKTKYIVPEGTENVLLVKQSKALIKLLQIKQKNQAIDTRVVKCFREWQWAALDFYLDRMQEKMEETKMKHLSAGFAFIEKHFQRHRRRAFNRWLIFQ